jgi:hypothetical protein
MTETPADSAKPTHTHTAYIRKTEVIRQGRRLGRWVEEGVARQEADGSINVYLHSLPIGGFDGRIHLAKLGTKPPDVSPMPQRPAAGDDDENPDE